MTEQDYNLRYDIQSRLMENMLESAPVAGASKIESVSDDSGRLYVFTIGNDGALYQIVSDESSLTSWKASRLETPVSIVDFSVVTLGNSLYIYLIGSSKIYRVVSSGPLPDNPAWQDLTAGIVFNSGMSFRKIRSGIWNAEEVSFALIYQWEGRNRLYIPLLSSLVSINSDEQIQDVAFGTMPESVTGHSGNDTVIFLGFGSSWEVVSTRGEAHQNNNTGIDNFSVEYDNGLLLSVAASLPNGSAAVLGPDGSFTVLDGPASAALGVSQYPEEIGSNPMVFTVSPGGGLFYSVRDAENTTEWTQLLPLGGALLNGREQLTVCRDSNGYPHLFAISENGRELFHIWQDMESTDWRLAPVSIDYESEVVNFSSYTTRVQVLDVDDYGNDSPVPHKPVRITATDYLSAVINGRSYQLNPDQAVVCETNAAGCLTVARLTLALSTPSLTLSSDGLPDVMVQSETYIADALSKPDTPEALASILSGAHTRVTGQKVVIADEDTILAVSQAIYQCADYINTGLDQAGSGVLTQRTRGSGAVPVREGAPLPNQLDLSAIDDHHWVIHFEDGRASFRWLEASEVASSACAQGQSAEGWTWGTLWNAIRQEITELRCVLVSKVSNALNVVVKFVVDGVETVFSYVVEIAQQVVDVIQGCLESIGTAFRTLFEWLGTLFDWSDILNTHDAIRILFTKYLDYLDSLAQSSEEKVSAFFDEAIANFQQDWNQLLGAGASTTMGGLQQQVAAETGVADTGSPHSNWLQDQLVNQAQYAGSVGSPAGTIPPAYQENAESFTTSLAASLDEQAGNGEGTISEELAQTLGQLFVDQNIKDIPLNDLVATIGDEIIEEGLDAVKSVILEAIDVLDDGLRTFKTVCTSEWNVPLVSKMYQKVAGSPLTLLDLCALVAAIPVTATYKSVETGVDVLNGEPVPNPPAQPFSDEALCVMSQLTPDQLYGGAPIDWSSLSSSCGQSSLVVAGQVQDVSTEKLPQLLQGIFGLINDAVFGLNFSLAAVNDFARQPAINGVREALNLVSGACTYPFYQSASTSDEVQEAKVGLWGAKLTFTMFNLPAIWYFPGEALRVVYPIMKSLEGCIQLGYSLNIPHVESGGEHYYEPASIQNYCSCVIPMSGVIRPGLVALTDTGPGAVVGGTGLVAIYSVGGAVVVGLNTYQALTNIAEAAD
ncbi:hypothetical protein [Microbulbifer litoralis]|uniref:hypothetical protein n=1 Tax=Microbulbifer litoralis TaxID=2933965 RepID=UPI0020293D7F|nr:hypothetical protein [Microbulbifer sp. GX H0434]